MRGGKRMAKQLDCTTNFESTYNNGIHGIHFSPHTTFSRLNRVVRKKKHELINFIIESFQSAEALQMLFSDLAFGLGIDGWNEVGSHIFGTLYYRNISNVFWSSYYISHFRHTWILN
jgi:hypothetical protein